MRFFVAAATAVLLAGLMAAPVAAASSFTCTGSPGSPEAIPAGTYQSLTMPAGSFCGVVSPGTVTVQRPLTLGAGAGLIVVDSALKVRGPLTVGPGAAFGADFAAETAPVEIDGPVTVQKDGAFILGTEIPYGPVFASIGGSVTGIDASAVIIQNVRIGGPVRVIGGGADNALVDAVAGGPGNNYTDFEDDVIGGPLVEMGYQGIWGGVIRSVIKGPFVFAHNVQSSVDEWDIGSNAIGGPAYCADNVPAPNLGPSNGYLSNVAGPTRGNQAATCTGVPSGITGPTV